MKNRWTLPVVALALLALLFGLWAGLLRMGWAFPSFASLALAHGPLMVSGFLGVLIPLERAVALRQRWMFGVPLCSGAGWIMLFLFPRLGALLMTLGSLGMLAILWVMWRRETQLHTLTLLLGGVTWIIGNLLWLFGQPIYRVVPWWMAFLLLTIAGERLELQRVLRPAGRERLLFLILAGGVCLSALLTFVELNLASRLLGLFLLGLSAWFLRFDLAIRNLKHPAPLTRYIAIALTVGFLWQAFSGLLFLRYGALYAGPIYDAVLHTFFVGFVFSMIFGHAPLIFPALSGKQARFSGLLYFPLGLLHLSLILRMGGDWTMQASIRQWGGLLNALAILVFFPLMIVSSLREE